MTKIGIFGGTFDPIHIGHLVICIWAKETLDLNSVLFIPTANPPHKQTAPFASIDNRYEMIRLAIKEIPFFKISNIEADTQYPSYTVNTLRYLRNIYSPKETELYLLIGEDSFRDLPMWREPEEIIRLSTVVVFRRNGTTDKNHPLYKNVRFLDTPVIGISSTLIRQRIRSHLPVTFLVPSNVGRYIKEKGLYQN